MPFEAPKGFGPQKDIAAGAGALTPHAPPKDIRAKRKRKKPEDIKTLQVATRGSKRIWTAEGYCSRCWRIYATRAPKGYEGEAKAQEARSRPSGLSIEAPKGFGPQKNIAVGVGALTPHKFPTDIRAKPRRKQPEDIKITQTMAMMMTMMLMMMMIMIMMMMMTMTSMRIC